MNTQKAEFADTDLANMAKRLDQIGWGIFLVMIGVIWLVPGVPQGTWLGDFTGIKLPLFPICLVIVGATLILKPLVSERA
jgi:hypothetical protein